MNKRFFLFMTVVFFSIGTFQLINVQADSNQQQTISANKGHSLVLTGDSDGNSRLLTWGWNEFNQLANDENPNELRPIEVTNLEKGEGDIVSLAAGKQHSLALTKAGNVLAWGGNNAGQVGNNKQEYTYSKPQKVLSYDYNHSSQSYNEKLLSNVLSIEAGDQHSVALKADGTVWTWGSNEYDQLGQHDYIPTGTKRVAEQVLGLENIIEISSYRSHNLALDDNGTVWAWGENWGGQMSTGLESTKTPYQVKDLPPIESIATGSFHSIAIDQEGNVWSWGINDFNQRNADDRNYATPYLVSGLTDIKSISAGDAHNLAINENGEVFAWGNNSYGEVGISQSTEIISKPIQLNELEDIEEVAAGDQYSIAKSKDGAIYTWGRNQHGQLGNGTNTDRHEPTSINISFVTGVKLNQHTVELEPDQTSQLKATVFPSDAISKDLVWSSSNEDVITVNRNGEITAVADSATVNKATITVTTKSGGYTDQAEVTIKVPVSGINIRKNALTLERVLTDDGLVDDTFKLHAQVYPFNATDKRIIWESEDDNGTASITVTTQNKRKRGEIRVKVEAGKYKKLSGFQAQSSISLMARDTKKIDVQFFPQDATNKQMYWRSNDKAIASVDNQGNVKGVSSGEVTLTGRTADGNYKQEVEVEVGPNVNGWLLAKQQNNVSRSKHWDITFNTPIDPKSVTEETVYIQDIYSRYVEANVSLSGNGKTISIKPEEKLRADTMFYLYITDDITSKKGTPLQNGTKMVFETY